MYERSHGYKYEEQKGKSLADIAKLIRRDIKQSVTDGLLPGAPVKYSVQTETYSGGGSISVTVRNWAAAWQDCDGYRVTDEPLVSGRGRELCRNHFCAASLELQGESRPGAEAHQVLTAEAQAAEMTLKRIHGAYNHDGSDSMVDYFDVNYYGGISFEDARGAAFEAREAEKRAARRAAVDELAAQSTKRVVVYGSGGRKKTIHDAVEVKGRYRLVCGATLWRNSVVGPADGKELTCSRCAKRAAAAAPTPSDPAPRVMHAFDVLRADGGVTVTRMSLEPGDDRVGQLIAATFSTAVAFKAAGAPQWIRFAS